MRMHAIEKWFVNHPVHGRRVGAAAVRRLRGLPYAPGRRYLDVGCGNGAACLALASQLGLEVVGIDVDPEQVRLAEEASCRVTTPRPVRFLVADATHLPFADGEFDFVGSSKATHHVPDWESAVREMLRVCRPGGHVVYLDFAVPGWLTRVLGRLPRKVLGGHGGLPDRVGLDRLAAQASVRTVRRRVVGLHYEVVWQRREPC